MSRRIAAIITAVTGDRIVIGEEELKHAKEEYFSMLPRDILLELIERILKDPTKRLLTDSGFVAFLRIFGKFSFDLLGVIYES